MYDIVIIDSGVNVSGNEKVDGISIRIDGDRNVVLDENIMDSIGHGTIIYQIIKRYAPSSKIYVIKIFDAQQPVTEYTLCSALEYVKENVQCRIINLSLGLRICDNIREFRDLCRKIVTAGTIIVSAFDNEHCYSYPACFDEVIGVDSDEKIKDIREYNYVEAGPVNVRAKGSLQRIKFDNEKIVIASGASIACAYMSAFIAENNKSVKLIYKEIMDYLKRHAAKIYISKKSDKRNVEISLLERIKKAAVFPISKEAHAFIRFGDMLHFDIKHYYDVRYSGKVGRKLSTIYPAATNMYIEDIEKADLNDIDTIILGHLDELNELCKCDYREKILKTASSKSINVYSFDDLSKYKDIYKEISVFYPGVYGSDVLQNTFGKLYKIGKPVVGIFGTSSSQGKFSLQLTMKRIFEKMGYKVGCIGTEPHALLFNMDSVYPMGYNSSIFLSPWESITYLNEQMNKLCEKGAEVIFVASQAGSTPQNFNNLMDYPIKQSIFLMGTHPDAILLCVNIYDEILYIKNTIQTLQGLSDSKVIALILYPLGLPQENRMFGGRRTVITKETFESFSKIIQMEVDLPVFLLGNQQHMYNLYQEILNFF